MWTFLNQFWYIIFSGGTRLWIYSMWYDIYPFQCCLAHNHTNTHKHQHTQTPTLTLTDQLTQTHTEQTNTDPFPFILYCIELLGYESIELRFFIKLFEKFGLTFLSFAMYFFICCMLHSMLCLPNWRLHHSIQFIFCFRNVFTFIRKCVALFSYCH